MKVKLKNGRVFVDNVECGYYVQDSIHRTWYAEFLLKGTKYVKRAIYKNDLRTLIEWTINN